MLATLREPKVPERACFLMSVTKMTVNKAHLQRKKAPAALPVFSPVGSHNTGPSSDSLNISQLLRELVEQDGRPQNVGQTSVAELLILELPLAVDLF